jgi:hypothetical protein
MIKTLGCLILGITLLGLAVVVTGFVLPREHTASVRAHYRAAPGPLYDAIIAVADGPKWRTGLEGVVVLEQSPLTWRETAEWGTLTMVMDEATPPSRVVTRIADTSEGFGGTWTYVIAPEENGSVVTITEKGFVDNPLFRVMSKFVFGHYKAMETYTEDLGRKFSETVQPERVR